MKRERRRSGRSGDVALLGRCGGATWSRIATTPPTIAGGRSLPDRRRDRPAPEQVPAVPGTTTENDRAEAHHFGRDLMAAAAFPRAGLRERAAYRISSSRDERDMKEVRRTNMKRRGTEPLVALYGQEGCARRSRCCRTHHSRPDDADDVSGRRSAAKLRAGRSAPATFPIIILVPPRRGTDQVVGFSDGRHDDYVPKPFQRQGAADRIKGDPATLEGRHRPSGRGRHLGRVHRPRAAPRSRGRRAGADADRVPPCGRADAPSPPGLQAGTSSWSDAIGEGAMCWSDDRVHIQTLEDSSPTPT